MLHHWGPTNAFQDILLEEVKSLYPDGLAQDFSKLCQDHKESEGDELDEESECCEDEGETLELLEVPDPEQETEGPSASTEPGKGTDKEEAKDEDLRQEPAKDSQPLDANHRKAGMFKHFGYELC